MREEEEEEARRESMIDGDVKNTLIERDVCCMFVYLALL
jgi:hypothetical protein